MSDQKVQVQPNWEQAQLHPLQAPNAFYTQVSGPIGESGSPDLIILGMGEFSAPVLTSSESDRARVIQKISEDGIQVNVIGRFAISRNRAQELVDMLTRAIVQFDLAEGVHDA